LRVVDRDWADYLCAYGTAFGFAIIAGGLALWTFRKYFPLPDEPPEPVASLAPFVGHVERVLYTGALFAGQPIFIGLWLTLKTLGSGDLLSKGGSKDRRVYQRFLVLSGASLAFSAVGWRMGDWILDQRDWLEPVLMGGGLVVGATILGWMASRQERPQPSGASEKPSNEGA
jgi:hypothetical protein